MLGRWFAVWVVAAGVLGTASAWAQEDLNRGKTPAQLFASDCAECHRNPRALNRDPGTLPGFLRVHYTASRESAAAIATYLISLGPNPRTGSRPASSQRRPAATHSQGQTQPAKPSETPPPKPAEPAAEAPAVAPPPASEVPATPAAPPPATPASPQ